MIQFQYRNYLNPIESLFRKLVKSKLLKCVIESCCLFLKVTMGRHFQLSIWRNHRDGPSSQNASIAISHDSCACENMTRHHQLKKRTRN